jgi:hypothetical protein
MLLRVDSSFILLEGCVIDLLFRIGLAPSTDRSAGTAEQHLARSVAVAVEEGVDKGQHRLTWGTANSRAHALVIEIGGEVNHYFCL